MNYAIDAIGEVIRRNAVTGDFHTEHRIIGYTDEEGVKAFRKVFKLGKSAGLSAEWAVNRIRNDGDARIKFYL